jgi:6,7-dimethyl-8-ribityllumazine synthase
MSSALNNLSEYDANNIPDGSKFHIHLVVSEWNQAITLSLAEAAKKTLIDEGVNPKHIKWSRVPGSYELIYGAKKAQEQKPDAVIVIGSVIKGETKHFEFICHSVAQGIKDLNVYNDVPVIFCVLTDDNLSQAKDRSGGKYGNKGVEAAIAALKMANFHFKQV